MTSVGSAPVSVATSAKQTDQAQFGPIATEREVDAIRYTQTAVNLREGPGTKFAVVTVIPKGSSVSILEERGNWSRIETEAKGHGWVANSTISQSPVSR
ncbi:SH3 domain-containing protein [Agrobacterium tumefaciens]|uniref:SH3 domain-containing protein n=1 Tax=Agrobacterium tumefaciens TaxID=358 RepID=UPI003BA0F4F7